MGGVWGKSPSFAPSSSSLLRGAQRRGRFYRLAELSTASRKFLQPQFNLCSLTEVPAASRKTLLAQKSFCWLTELSTACRKFQLACETSGGQR
jgi:hypothetical protein